MLCTTGFCTELHTVEAGNEYALSPKSPIIVRWSRCVWWLQLYSPSALKTTVSSNHLCLGGSDSRFNAVLPLHAFCTQVQVNFRNGLTHLFPLPLPPAMWRDFESRTNIVNNSSARVMARDPVLGSSKTMSTSIQKLNSHLGLVFDGGADVKKRTELWQVPQSCRNPKEWRSGGGRGAARDVERM